MTHYPTDLTEKQWQVIKNILEPQARKRIHSLREIMNAKNIYCTCCWTLQLLIIAFYFLPTTG